MRALLAFATAIGLSFVASAAERHPCADDAEKRALPLLKLHFEVEPGQATENFGIAADETKTLPSINALVGKGKFDVIEVLGYIYRAEYRMRFIYAQIPDSCVLMGQEIIEMSDPY